MSSSPSYVQYVLEQLSELEDIRCRAMMGEYLIYYRQKLVGGIYNNQFLVKPILSDINYVQTPEYTIPYAGAKPMLLVPHLDSRSFVAGLLEVMYPDIPLPKPKKKKT